MTEKEAKECLNKYIPIYLGKNVIEIDDKTEFHVKEVVMANNIVSHDDENCWSVSCCMYRIGSDKPEFLDVSYVEKYFEISV